MVMFIGNVVSPYWMKLRQESKNAGKRRLKDIGLESAIIWNGMKHKGMLLIVLLERMQNFCCFLNQSDRYVLLRAVFFS